MEPSRVTLEEAQELFQICMPGIKKEEKPAADCLGQILAEPVYAAVTQPPFPRSAMDGFALRSRDVCGADLEHPVTLEVAGCVYAGQKTELILEPHQAVRIMTGAMIPEGADCVVKQEDTDYVRIADPDQDRKTIKIYNNVGPGENYCPKGEDFSAGELLAEAGLLVDSYLLAAVLGRVDFSSVAEAAWVGLPIHWNETAFWALSDGNTSLLITSVITIMPIALATMVEHIGDISAISSTVGVNYIKDPGLHRTLLGDGLATIIASLFGAPANTTYGENTGVLSLTKVFDPRVIRIAAGFAVLFSFSPKVAALIGCMPTATCGGVSLVLYGMISAVGVRNIVETQVDFTKSRNVIIAALILVLSIGINYSAAGAIAFHIGEITISLSGRAVGALAGIILNAILPGKDYKFDEDKPDDTGVCFAVKGEEN